MVDNTLTDRDKARLLASTDIRSNSGRDEALYQSLKRISAPLPQQMDGQTRRAITAFVMESWDSFKIIATKFNLDHDSITMGAMTEMLTTGYELGRKLQKPLAAPANNPSREDN